jgi:hypothetical protein
MGIKEGIIAIIVWILIMVSCCVVGVSMNQHDAIDYSIRTTTDTANANLMKITDVLVIGIALLFTAAFFLIMAHSTKPAAHGYTGYRFGKALPGAVDRGQGVETPEGYRVLPHGAGRAFPTSYDAMGRPTSWQLGHPPRTTRFLGEDWEVTTGKRMAELRAATDKGGG